MSRYMLDTDICSCIMKRSNPSLLRRLEQDPVNDVCISVITKSELLFGVELSPGRHQDQLALDAFLGYVEVLDFPDEAASHYAKIRAHAKGSRSDDRRERSFHRCPCPERRRNSSHE